MSLAVELTIIIVNWNGGDLLRRAVESIIASPPSLAYEILIIDNASSDQSLATLRASASIAPLLQEQRLRIIENSENSGFGKANNQAFAIAHGSLFFLLNPDTEVTQGSLDVLIETIRANKQIGGVGQKLVNTDGSLQVSVWRNPPAAWEILLSQLKLYLLLPRRVRGTLLLGGHWDHDRIRDVPML